jgi:4-amino-4-deoxy-L-arabinose transferase-like glycosyltransferase
MQTPTDTPALAPSPRDQRWRWLLVATVLLALGMLVARNAAPSDLDGKHQPKTVAYTVDMALHGRMILPQDMQGVWSTKPPLYNWVALPVVGGLGIYKDWSFKLPSLLAALVITALTWWGATRLLAPRDADEQQRRWAGGLAMMIWLSLPPVVALAYIARPDMLLGMWLVLGWLMATHVMQQERVRWWQPALIWVSVAAAWLTKGPAALLVPIYIAVAAYPLTGQFWKPILRTWLPVGLPLSFGPFVWWVWRAHEIAPQYMGVTMVMTESTRLRGADQDQSYLMGLLATLWKYPFYFVARALPWSWVVLALAIVGPPPTKRSIGMMRAAWIWCAVIFVFFNLAVLKRDDYLLPAYPAVAAMIAWGLLAFKNFAGARGRARLGLIVTAFAVVVIAGVVLNDAYLNPNRKGRWADEARKFGLAVNQHVGDEPLVFERSGFHPVQAYMGRNQAMRSPTPAMWSEAQWCVAPLVLVDDRQPVLTSGVLPNVLGKKRLKLGLYPREEGKPWPPVLVEPTPRK